MKTGISPNSITLMDDAKFDINDAAYDNLINLAQEDQKRKIISPSSTNTLCTNGGDCVGSDNTGCRNTGDCTGATTNRQKCQVVQ